MAFKVNYGLERAERNRAKQAKKEAKLRERKANSEGEPSAELPEANEADEAIKPDGTAEPE